MKYQHFHCSVFSCFFIFWLFDFSVLRFFIIVLLFRFYVFFHIFSKMMKIYRFYKHLCSSGDFLVAKSRRQQRPAHVHLEQGFPLFRRFWGLRNVFFSIAFFNQLSQKHKFLLSQIDYWTPPFWRPFFNYVHENPKMRLRDAPKILKKTTGFISVLVSGLDGFLTLGGFRKTICTILSFCIFHRNISFYCFDCHTGRLLFSMIFLCFLDFALLQL